MITKEKIIEKGELCKICGNKYLTIWQIPDNLWKRIVDIRNGSGLICPKCFDELARKKGIELYWECYKDEFPTQLQTQEIVKEVENYCLNIKKDGFTISQQVKEILNLLNQKLNK